MAPDFSALASGVAARADLLGCLVLSRDGLTLGAFPPGGDGEATRSWARLAALGDVDRGFILIGQRLWGFVRGADHSLFAVAPAAIRPGVLLEALDQGLRELERSIGEPTPAPRPADGPPGTAPPPGPRSETGSRPGRPTKPPQGDGATVEERPLPGEQPREPAPQPPPEFPPGPPPGDPLRTHAEPPEEAPIARMEGLLGGGEDEPDVDRVALAREFGDLLQEAAFGDED